MNSVNAKEDPALRRAFGDAGMLSDHEAMVTGDPKKIKETREVWLAMRRWRESERDQIS